MIKTEKDRSLGIYVFLIGMIVILTGLKIRYGYKGEEVTEPATMKAAIITPTVTVTPKNDYPVWQQLPYQGTGYTVEKYTAPKTLQVKINNGDKQLIENEVRKWLEGLGEVGEGHKIEWE